MTDPKGTVLVECGKMLEKGGYVIKSLNTINFRKSMHYNPFSFSAFTQKSSPDLSPSPFVLTMIVLTSLRMSFSLRM